MRKSKDTLVFKDNHTNSGNPVTLKQLFDAPVAGSNTQILFNDAGTTAGNANLTFNKSTNTLTANNISTTSSLTVNGTSTLTGLATASTGINLYTSTTSTPVGIIYKNNNRFIHDFNYGNNGTVTTQGENTFLGINAGNLTMGSTAIDASQASYNTAIGNGSLQSNTTGSINTALGARSLLSNTTGEANTAIGKSSLQSNTTGSNNTAIGLQASRGNITGSYNTSIGYNSLSSNNASYNTSLGYLAMQNITTGDFNIAIGPLAGNQILPTGNNTTSSKSIYLGYNTRAGANGNTNEIVIGYNADGNGSNTATLGNNSITKTYLKGSINATGITAGFEKNMITMDNAGNLYKGELPHAFFGFADSDLV